MPTYRYFAGYVISTQQGPQFRGRIVDRTRRIRDDDDLEALARDVAPRGGHADVVSLSLLAVEEDGLPGYA